MTISRIFSLLTNKKDYFMGKYTFKTIARIAVICVIIGTSNFILLSSIAALLYPGGYKYFEYVFSDLGRVKAFNNEYNLMSSTVFSFTVVTTALLQIPFWLVIRHFFTQSGFEKKMSSFGSFLGLTTVFIQVGIAFFPIDTEELIHAIFAQSFFLLTGFSILIYSIIIFQNGNYNRSYAYTGFFISLAVILFILGIYGFLQAFMQKMIVYSYVIWILIQAYNIWIRSSIC
ncbi:MAG: DUF998 domain-containing protein [Candidatus Hodarchaeota archaeon]